jgi:hypothetical protein
MKNATSNKFLFALTVARSTLLSLEREAAHMGMWEMCPTDGRYLSRESAEEVREKHLKDMLEWVESVRVEYTQLYKFIQKEEGRTRPRGLNPPSELYFRWER